MDEVQFEQRGGLAIATLDRPRALNAMTLGMYRALAPRLAAWAANPSVVTVVLRGAGRGFCAGGDVRTLYDARSGDGAYATALFAEEYRFVRAVHRFPKPYVAVAHGITMGGGAGLSVNGRFRVATETTQLAMPEVFIGSIPDVGATRFLGRCPGRIGLYLGLTGARLGAADALYCGLVTHVVAQDRLDALTAALAEVGAADVTAILARYAVAPGPPPLAPLQPAINRCFGAPSVEAIRAALEEERADLARAALAAMDRASPTSLKLVFRQLQRGGGIEMEIEEALALEYRVIRHLLLGHDFYEGVRAVVVDKDRQPRWRLATLAEVTDAEVERHFASLGAGELVFP